MYIKPDPRFDLNAQMHMKIQKQLGNEPKNPDPFHRRDFEFDPLRQAEGRAMEQNNLNPPRMAPCIPTPREELNWHDPPALRRPPIDMHRHVTPGNPVTPPFFDPPKPTESIAFKLPEPPKYDYLDPYKKKKEPWEY